MVAVASRYVELRYSVPDVDDRWVLEEENVPESALHDAIIHLLVEILHAWAARVGRVIFAGSNIALRWDAKRPQVGVDPDVYFVEPPPPDGEDSTSLCTWKPGQNPPRVAVEVVSENTADKDYGDGPERYAASGTEELWVFDPLRLGPELRGGPYLLQLWERDERGAFVRTYAGDGPVRSQVLDAWLVVTSGGRRLRLANDPYGNELWPTEAETERAEKEIARAEVEALRAELARLRGG